MTVFPPAPLFAALADGPDGGAAFWLTARDGTRLRAALWGADARQDMDPGAVAPRGTVLLFPGRTEYVEKYGRAARDLRARGYATLAIDWRGQGLSDRALPDRMVGHVGNFDEYQQDVAALLDLAEGLGLPQPFHLLSHSMGGAIGLRALLRGIPVRAAVFSAPMWGISMALWQRPMADAVTRLSRWAGQSHRLVPSTSAHSYVAQAEFAGNVLTHDPEMWAYMKRQLQDQPALLLGGPSLAWLRAALTECARLSLAPAPDIPALTAVGTAERVVDLLPIRRRMAGWPGARLEIFSGAAHEVPMELPVHRTRFFDLAAALFDAQG